MKAFSVRVQDDRKAEIVKGLAELDGVSISEEIERAIYHWLEFRVANREEMIREFEANWDRIFGQSSVTADQGVD